MKFNRSHILGKSKLRKRKERVWTFIFQLTAEDVALQPCLNVFRKVVVIELGKIPASSELIANSDPAVVQVVAPTKYLQVVALGYQRLADIVDLFGLLGLSTPHAEDYVAVDAASNPIAQITLVAHKARLLGMLQVIAMPLVDLSVDGLLHPDDLVYQPSHKVKVRMARVALTCSRGTRTCRERTCTCC